MDKIIHLSVFLHTPPDKAFDMFTNSHLLESWLTVLAEVEPVIGGKFELFWEPEDKANNSTLGCKITAIEKNKFLSFEWHSPKQFKHFANTSDPLTHVVVFFIPKASNTEVHLIHSGWRSSSEWEEARIWQEKAWKLAFNTLVKHFENNTNGS
jgi:uncharacterized protein YndB with AHSA1/START domain